MQDGKKAGRGTPQQHQQSTRHGERPANRQGAKQSRQQNRLGEELQDHAQDDLSRPSSRGEEAGTTDGTRRAQQRLGEKHRRARQGEDGSTINTNNNTIEDPEESYPAWAGDSPRRAGHTNPRRAAGRGGEERERQAPHQPLAAATHRAGGNGAKAKADLLGGVDARRELSAAGDRSAGQLRGRDADKATLDDTVSRKASARSTRSGKKEKEEQIYGSLTERANRVVAAPDYLQRLSDIKQGKTGSRYMDFIMDGVKIGVPYNGLKVTNGYLKKETQSKGILMSRSWQLKYCVLDLSRFEFKYAKNPTQEFTRIQLKGIIDVFIEDDPARKDGDKSIFSLGRTDKSLDGFNFQIQTPQRIFRMQASTKVEQTMWIRAFAVLFELRARVLAQFNSRTLETINSRRESEQVYSPLSQYSSKLMSQRKQQSNRQKESEQQQSLANAKGRHSTRNADNDTIELTNKQQENTRRRNATHQKGKRAEEAKEDGQRGHRGDDQLDDRIDQLRQNNFGRPSLPDAYDTIEPVSRFAKPPMTTKAANQCMTQRDPQGNAGKQPANEVLGGPAKHIQKSAATTRNKNQNQQHIKFYDDGLGTLDSGNGMDTMNTAAYRTNQPASTNGVGELMQLDDLLDKQAEVISPGKAKKRPESLNTARQAEELKQKKLELQKKLTALQHSKVMMESTLTDMRSVRAAASKQPESTTDGDADAVRQETEYDYEYDDEYDDEYDAEVERGGSRLTQQKKGTGRHSKMSKMSSKRHTPSKKMMMKAPLKAGTDDQRHAKKSPGAKDLAIEDVQVPDVAGKRSHAPTAHIQSTQVEAYMDGVTNKKNHEWRQHKDEEEDRRKSTSSKILQKVRGSDDRNQERNKRQQLSIEQQPADFHKLHQFSKGFLSDNVKPAGRRNQPYEDDERMQQQISATSLQKGVDPEPQYAQIKVTRPAPSTRYSAAGTKLKVKLSQGVLQRLSQERSRRQLGGLTQVTERNQLRNSGNQHALQLLKWAAKGQAEQQSTLLSARAHGPKDVDKDEERINPLQQLGLSRQHSQAPSNASFGATSRAKVKLKTFRLSNQNGHWLTSAKKAGREGGKLNAHYQSAQHNEYSNGNQADIGCSSTVVEKFRVDQDMFRLAANEDQDGGYELGTNIWSKTSKDARASTNDGTRNSEPRLGFVSAGNQQKTQNQQSKGHLNFYASTGGANGALARPNRPNSPTTKSTMTKEKSSSIASLKLEKHKTKKAYKLPIKVASRKRVKADADTASGAPGGGVSSARQQTIPLQSKYKESQGVRGTAIPTTFGQDQQLQELQDEASADIGVSRAPVAAVSETFINNLMSQSSVTNRVKGLNINGPTTAETSLMQKPTQFEGKREGRFEPPVLPAAGCLDTDLGFVDLLNRESDSCFVERIGKQEKIKQRASACSERSRCSGLGSRSSSLAEKDVRERQNSRKRHLLESQGSQLRLHGAQQDGRNAPLKDPFEYFGDQSQKTRKQQILIPKRSALDEQKSPGTAGTPQERVYANFSQRQQLNFSNISRISGDLHQSTLDSRHDGLVSFDHGVRPQSRPQPHQGHPASSHSTTALPAPQPIIQNIRIDQSTNNVFNFYNYSNNGDLNSQANQSKSASATQSPEKEAPAVKGGSKEAGRSKAKAAGKASSKGQQIQQKQVEVIEDILEDW